jgi:ABC-type Fe3+ transport system substrate-binding protein
VLLFLIVSKSFLDFASPLWLAHWTTTDSLSSGSKGLIMYVLIQLSFVLFGQFIFVLTAYMATRASNTLHQAWFVVPFSFP